MISGMEVMPRTKHKFPLPKADLLLLLPNGQLTSNRNKSQAPGIAPSSKETNHQLCNLVILNTSHYDGNSDSPFPKLAHTIGVDFLFLPTGSWPINLLDANLCFRVATD